MHRPTETIETVFPDTVQIEVVKDVLVGSIPDVDVSLNEKSESP